MNNFAIKGHKTRGKDVIELLQSFGGENINLFDGSDISAYFFIDKNGNIATSRNSGRLLLIECFTLEEFFKKYPYKVGDKVVIKDYNLIHEISRLQWLKEKSMVLYHTKSEDGIESYFVAEELEPYEEVGILEPVKNIDSEEMLYFVDKNNGKLKECNVSVSKPIVAFDYTVDDKTGDIKLIIPENMEMELKSGEFILRDKRSKYPKTYKECCDILDTYCTMPSRPGYKQDLFSKFQELIICRDAYWKLKTDWYEYPDGWRPSKKMNDDDWNYEIYTVNGEVFKGYGCRTENNRILTFPTEEMRDAFYDNFKDLIESCKEFI